jgi:hypothetical protein
MDKLHLRRAAFCLDLSALAAGAASAQAPKVDWKIYGGGSSYQGPDICFYEAAGSVHEVSGLIRVWTKCITIAKLENTKMSNSAIDAAARKVRGHYVPPFATIQKMSNDETLSLIAYEAQANEAKISPMAQIYFELDCRARRMHNLSIILKMKDKTVTSDKPTDWQYVPPESAGANLLSFICTK